jgi:hypothetical protein
MQRPPQDKVPREWLTYIYHDPRGVLIGLADAAAKHGPLESRTMRKREMRPYAQHWQAALFCYGMSQMASQPLQYAMAEHEDYDCIFRGVVRGVPVYSRVQLKELPPAEINPEASLEKGLQQLECKYYSGNNLVVAMHVNRAMERFRVGEVAIPKHLRISELWLYGCINPPRGEWLVYGNMLGGNPRLFPFRFPREDARDIL